MDTPEIQKDSIGGDVKDASLVLSGSHRYNDIFKMVLLKTERLVSATYLVTSVMDIKETIRWELRSLSVRSIKDFYVLGRLSSDGSKSFVSDKILNRISCIISSTMRS